MNLAYGNSVEAVVILWVLTGIGRSGGALLPSARQHPSYGDWRLRGNIIRTALCCVVWHNVHSQQHTYMSSSYRSSRLGLSHCVETVA